MVATPLSCASNCTATSQPIPANPDIAGIGIITASLTTTSFALLLYLLLTIHTHHTLILNKFRQWILCSQRVYTPSSSRSCFANVLRKTLLACSDIHLLMGLGVQIVGLMKGCEMSLYHFRIAAQLGFLSTITNLLAVVALRDGFVQKRWTNSPRVFFVLANLAVSGYMSWVAYSYDTAESDLSMSMGCFFESNRSLDAALVGRWAGLMLGAIGAHGSVVDAIFFFDEPKETERKRWWVWKIGGAIRTWVVAPAYAVYGVYMAGDGLSHTQALGTPNVRIEGSETEWGFGQLLPVLLLALPLLAGWEAFWEGKGEARKERSGKKNWRVEKGMIGSPIPKTSQDSSEEEKGSSVESTSPIYTPYSLSPDFSEEEKRTESNGSSPEIPKIYHLSAFKDPQETYNGRPGTIVEEETHTRVPQPTRQRTSTSRRSLHFSYPNRVPPRSSQARLSQARLSQFQDDAQPILCGHCEALPRESLYLATDPNRRSRRSSHRRSQAVRASYVPL